MTRGIDRAGDAERVADAGQAGTDRTAASRTVPSHRGEPGAVVCRVAVSVSAVSRAAASRGAASRGAASRGAVSRGVTSRATASRRATSGNAVPETAA
ncbi:hypothetical protein FB384_001107 [Prauserella sediminis]|uniref:Uncharacterized protein n=1 Tax=Prauserella sediminis TaxID=577680 RepID=A0A839XNB9_9PSEU|nr:hypothetical protein [Prauserella sediminis]